MRFILSFAIMLTVCSCDLFEDQLPEYSVTVTDVENTRAGVRVSFVVDDNGGEPIAAAGVTYSTDSLRGVSRNQLFVDSLSSDTLSVIWKGIDDGPYYFTAFAAFEDGFYALSAPVSFDVRAFAPSTSCNPADNSLTLANERCGTGSVTVYSVTRQSGEYEVTANCQFLDRNTLTLTFPRNPTSGTYRTTSSRPRAGTSSKEVYATVQVSSNFTVVPEFQEVYVDRSGGRTTITLCENTFFLVGRQRPLSGRIVFDN